MGLASPKNVGLKRERHVVFNIKKGRKPLLVVNCQSCVHKVICLVYFINYYSVILILCNKLQLVIPVHIN